MATIKAYTDTNQSKKLAEFLPPESADMWWREVSHGFYHIESETPKGWYDVPPEGIPCWSLSALLEVIRVECRMEKTPLDQSGEFTYSMVDDYNNIRTFECGNPIDACVEMIIKLNEQKLL